jgi:hypothetical protein
MQAEKTTTQSHHADSHIILVPDGEIQNNIPRCKNQGSVHTFYDYRQEHNEGNNFCGWPEKEYTT